MKPINGYWTDKNNNKWDTKIYSREQAENNSKSLYGCTSCIRCHNCRDCSGCHGYADRPQHYTTGRIGSRNDQTTFYFGETKSGASEIQVVCGCFRGDLEEFEAKVKETHGDNEYAKQYMAEIAKVRTLWGE